MAEKPLGQSPRAKHLMAKVVRDTLAEVARLGEKATERKVKRFIEKALFNAAFDL